MWKVLCSLNKGHGRYHAAFACQTFYVANFLLKAPIALNQGSSNISKIWQQIRSHKFRCRSFWQLSSSFRREARTAHHQLLAQVL